MVCARSGDETPSASTALKSAVRSMVRDSWELGESADHATIVVLPKTRNAAGIDQSPRDRRPVQRVARPEISARRRLPVVQERSVGDERRGRRLARSDLDRAE